jgi:putative transposase
MLAMVANWPEYLREAMDQSLAEKIHAHSRTGRPLGEEAFLSELEERLKRRLRPQKRGPKPRSETGE